MVRELGRLVPHCHAILNIVGQKTPSRGGFGSSSVRYKMYSQIVYNKRNQTHSPPLVLLQQEEGSS